MKTFPQRRQRRAFVTQASILAVIILALLPGFGRAQVFNNSVLTEYQYPGFGIVTNTTHSFTYTMSHIDFMTTYTTPPTPAPGSGPYTSGSPTNPLSDLTLHTWDGPGVQGGVAYLNTANPSSTPSTSIYDQGFIIYPNAQGIEVSLQQDENGYAMYPYGTNGAWYVIVSYWTPVGRGGPGHYVDVYIWNQPPPNGIGGLTFVSTTQLSTIGSYTRISQDGHNTYGFCITWEDPANGIDFVYGFMNSTIGGPSISPVYTLGGTAGETHPDVAFTHAAGGLLLQFLYYHVAGGNIVITESSTPMVLGPGWPSVAPTPLVNDVNTLPYTCSAVTPDLKTRIDAPDHYGPADWAYTYIYQPVCGAIQDEIYVRYDASSVASTYCLTNGSIAGLAACDIDPSTFNTYVNDWPVCSFDVTQTQLNVEWYTTYQNSTSIPTGFFLPNVGGYVGLKIDNTGALASASDFLQVGENATGSNTLASHTPTIASSRQNDRTDYQFVAFANIPNMSPVMMIKDRPWASGTFKGGGHATPWAGLYSPAATANTVKTVSSVSAYPNPFTDKISLSISADLMDKALNVSVEDECGRVMDKFTAEGNEVNARLATTSSKLNDGIYFVKVMAVADEFSQTIKIQKLAAH